MKLSLSEKIVIRLVKINKTSFPQTLNNRQSRTVTRERKAKYEVSTTASPNFCYTAFLLQYEMDRIQVELQSP